MLITHFLLRIVRGSIFVRRISGRIGYESIKTTESILRRTPYMSSL